MSAPPAAPTAALPVPAGIDPATARHDRHDRFVSGITLDGRHVVEHLEDGWAVLRLADRESLLFVPSLEVALGGIASGRVDRELDAWKARREQRRRETARAMEAARVRIELAEDARELVTDGRDRW